MPGIAIEWKADFATMEILLNVPFNSPALLLDFIVTLKNTDERFQKAGIVDALQISRRFNIKVGVANGNDKIWYKLVVYKLCAPLEIYDRFDIELTPEQLR